MEQVMLKNNSLIAVVTLLIFSSYAQADQSKESGAIEKQKSELEQRINDERRLKQNEEVKSQGTFIADWPKYSDDVEDIKQLDDKIKDLQKQIDALEKQKADIGRSQKPQN